MTWPGHEFNTFLTLGQDEGRGDLVVGADASKRFMTASEHRGNPKPKIVNDNLESLCSLANG